MAKIGLLGATFTTSNLGVSALAEGSIRALLHRFPDADVYLLDYDREARVFALDLDGHKRDIRLVNLRFSKNLFLPNNVAWLIMMALLMRLVPALRPLILRRNPWLREIHSTEFFAAISGGDSFSDIYGLGRLFYVSLPQILVLLCGKRLALLPQTLGPYRTWVARAVARFILRRAEIVYSRDREGVQKVHKLLGPGTPPEEVQFCYDVGFLIAPRPPERLRIAGLPEERPSGTPLVGLNVSGLLYMGGYTQNNMFGLKADYRELVSALLECLIEKKGADVLLVPHVFGGEVNPESDAAVSEQTFAAHRERYAEKLGVVRGTYDQNEIKYIIGLCDFFVGSRMHACIAALSQCIPAVAIAYSDKFAGVMASLGIVSLVVDPRKLDIQDLIHQIDETYERKDKVKEELAQRVPQVRENVLNLFRDVSLLGEARGGTTASTAAR